MVVKCKAGMRGRMQSTGARTGRGNARRRATCSRRCANDNHRQPCIPSPWALTSQSLVTLATRHDNPHCIAGQACEAACTVAVLAPSAVMFVGKLSARGGPRAVASKHQSKDSKVGKQGTKLIPLSKREDFASEELGQIMRQYL